MCLNADTFAKSTSAQPTAVRWLQDPCRQFVENEHQAALQRSHIDSFPATADASSLFLAFHKALALVVDRISLQAAVSAKAWLVAERRQCKNSIQPTFSLPP